MKNILLSLMFVFLFTGCFNNKPKCDDEDVKLTLKSILDNDEWVYVEYGLNEQSLRALRAHFKPLLDLKDYANEVVYTSFESFITKDSKDKKTSFCMGQLKFTYPQMPNEMREKYSRGTLKGVLFDGGEYETQISYSARFSDDKKQVF
ncbi:hypothetical protein DSU76_08565, partial [Campylobacter jejuni]|nr:hypothetical protein [Campylobacter jejuni]